MTVSVSPQDRERAEQAVAAALDKFPIINLSRGEYEVPAATAVSALLAAGWGPADAGMCGHQGPFLGGGPPILCTLRSGHAGWHENEHGTWWGLADHAQPPPSLPGSGEPG